MFPPMLLDSIPKHYSPYTISTNLITPTKEEDEKGIKQPEKQAMHMEIERLIKEINWQELPYEERVDLFNEFQIPTHIKYLSPLRFLAALFNDIRCTPRVFGFSHSGNVSSGINGLLNKPDRLASYGVEFTSKNVVCFTYREDYKFLVHRNGKMWVQERNISIKSTGYDLPNLYARHLTEERAAVKANKFLKHFAFDV